ncbi:MAG: methyltransferase [Candidatus Muproteobacteria bacterium RBG_16_64_11]|uniref:Methyltransferase n=1 Tax=Candidatus Muproteobacteria bacterium RBG_16_64_11 TaxID=1817758 RepID=A0A1F6TEK4_9PROT|nr:MAG: methyltransferase [Candidatus Muproteobacteria bacterium RBG_16_64_11]
MDPNDYDDWYQTPRGRWIGETEYRLLHTLLAPAPGEHLLDVGCGTGYFTRRFAHSGSKVTGIDSDPAMLAFARRHAVAKEQYLTGDARALPFPDRSFDLGLSVTALCFIPEQRQALAEILRVTRRRFAIGLLNRHSLLYLQKGRGGGRGAYRDAHWHTAAEVRILFAGLPVTNLKIQTAVLLPTAGKLARLGERWLGGRIPGGAFLVATGDVPRGAIRDATD